MVDPLLELVLPVAYYYILPGSVGPRVVHPQNQLSYGSSDQEQMGFWGAQIQKKQKRQKQMLGTKEGSSHHLAPWSVAVPVLSDRIYRYV
jgi:hypothetical protein